MSYSVDDIKTLEFPESVQRRTGMYLGEQAKNETSPGQKCVAVREILDNSITEVVKGYGDKVNVLFEKDGTVVVEDNGRGIPVGIDKSTGQNGIEKCMAELHSGGNFSRSDGKAGPGLNGVGGACVNAVSSEFLVEVLHKGKLFCERFENGYVVENLSKRKLTEEDVWCEFTDMNKVTGTRITFKLNDDFFSDVDNLIVDDIIERMRYTVYVVPNLNIIITDNTRSEEDGGGTYDFKNDGGIEGMLDHISTGDPILTDQETDYTKKGIFHISTNARYKQKITEVVNGSTVVKEKVNSIPIEVAFRYGDDESTDIRSFANTIRTFNGGVHQSALENALMDVFGKLAKKGA